MLIAEVFGHGVESNSAEAKADRSAKRCPFRDSPCTKSSKTDPIGICSLESDGRAAAICPVRFVEHGRIFKDAAKIAFGEGATFGVFPEVRVLKIVGGGKNGADKKIGKVDYLLGRLEDGDVVDFCAVEVQAVYFSGTTIRPALQQFLETEILDAAISDRRPDYRSSAQKRLVPQLQLKVPIFRRWGKRFFVVVDSCFFDALPSFGHTTPGNSELTWLSYPLNRQPDMNYTLEDPTIINSVWDDVSNALREGVPPDPMEITEELQSKVGTALILTS